MELELEHMVVYLVHLSLGGRTRHQQLSALYDLVRKTDRPFLVTGDFNMLWGEQEIDLFLAATGLEDANRAGLPTYPSRNPSQHLDFVLHSKDIKIRNFQVPQVTFSDHLPLVVDFDVDVAEDQRHGEREPTCFCDDLSDLSAVGFGNSKTSRFLSRQCFRMATAFQISEGCRWFFPALMGGPGSGHKAKDRSVWTDFLLFYFNLFCALPRISVFI